MLIVLATVLVLLAVGSALETAGRSGRSQPPPAPVPPPARPSPPSQAVVARIPVASLAPATVRARAGDLVKLTVASQQPGIVTIDGYDRIEPVESQSPARFSFLAKRIGSFPVRFRASGQQAPGSPEGPPGRRVGLLVVDEARSSSTSP